MASGVSGRQLAKLLGVSDMAVRKAEKARRIKKQADGLYDPDACRSAWGRSTDPSRSRVREPANQTREPANPGENLVAVRTEDDAKAAIQLITRVLQAEGVEASEIDFNAARTADTILKAYQRDLAMKQLRKELVSLSAVREHVAKAFIGYRQAMQRMPSRHVPEMAAALGVDPGELHAAIDRMIRETLTEMSAPVVNI